MQATKASYMNRAFRATEGVPLLIRCSVYEGVACTRYNSKRCIKLEWWKLPTRNSIKDVDKVKR